MPQKNHDFYTLVEETAPDPVPNGFLFSGVFFNPLPLGAKKVLGAARERCGEQTSSTRIGASLVGP